MAVTSIWPITGKVYKVIDYARNPEKTRENSPETLSDFHTVDGVIEYTADELKTEKRSYVTCIGCISEETAAQEFTEVKLRYGKTGGRTCYHGYQSFKENEVTAEIAHAIGVKLAERLWGDRFQVVVATHCNTNHYHNHFVINSVSDMDGYKFCNTKADYWAMRKESDRLCREYGLSVVENPEKRKKHYAEYNAEKHGKPTNRGTIRKDIDNAVNASLTKREFFAFLENLGYEFKLYKKNGDFLEYPALKPLGAKGFFRFHKLGSGYDFDDVMKRINKNYCRTLPFSEEALSEVREYRRKNQPPYTKKKTGLCGLYLRYCFELNIIEKYPASAKRVSFFMREDLVKMDRLDEQTRFLAKTQISDAKELLTHKSQVEEKIKGLTDKRKDLKNAIRRLNRQNQMEKAEELKGEVSEITKELADLRKEVKLCDGILARSARTQEELERLLDYYEKDYRRKEDKNELFQRGSGTSVKNDIGNYGNRR